MNGRRPMQRRSLIGRYTGTGLDSKPAASRQSSASGEMCLALPHGHFPESVTLHTKRVAH